MQLPSEIEEKLLEIGAMILKGNGRLDQKTRALIALSTAVAAFCSHGHGEFRSLARRLGAAEEEIEEAETIALRMRERCQTESGLFEIANQQVV